LSAPEREIYLADLTAGPASEFHRALRCRLEVPVREETLAAAFEDVCRREPRVRCRIRRHDTGFHFEPVDAAACVYAESLHWPAGSPYLHRRLTAEAQRSIDPVHGPLARGTLLRYDGIAELTLVVHRVLVTMSPHRLLRLLAESGLPGLPATADRPGGRVSRRRSIRRRWPARAV
jgi:hypothetical protein